MQVGCLHRQSCVLLRGAWQPLEPLKDYFMLGELGKQE